MAIVPARGGSKRIPRKNIRPFLGEPLLARTLRNLRDATLFDRIVVSTDDEEIAGVARQAGGEVPFERPYDLAGDHAATQPVVAHAILELGLERDAEVCVVYPAAVFTTIDDLRTTIELLRSSPGAAYVAVATGFGAPIQRALRRRRDGTCEMVWPEHRRTRSQDLEEFYHDAGQFYWGRAGAWIDDEPMFAGTTLLHVVPRWRTQDIDDLEDWALAELLFELLDRDRERP